jgi:beta-N-acetylhexosaminidase
MARIISLGLVAAILAGCGGSASTSLVPGSSPSSMPSGQSSSAVAATATPSPTATGLKVPGGPIPTPSRSGTQVSTCVVRTLAGLTEAQRIGQLFMIGLAKDKLGTAERAAIATYHFGSVSFTTKTAIGVKGVRAIADAVQAQASSAATGGIRFFVAANQEGGLVQALSGPGFDTIPTALSQGGLATATLESKAARWGSQLRSAGIDLDLAPVADVVPPGTDATNAPIGKLKREYGHTPSGAASHVVAFIGGMQRAGVVTTAKHFPGLGRVVGNTDFADAVTDTVTTTTDSYLQPFQRAIDAGVPVVMVSLATYERIDPKHLAVFSPAVIKSLLHDKLGFRGVVASDSLGATAVKAFTPAARAIDFLDAGGDLIVVNELSVANPMAEAIAARVATDATFRKRVDDAVRTILTAKHAAGLLPCGG